MSTDASPATPEYGDPRTRERILTVTRSLLTELGPTIKLSDVARAAGVSRQALYLHFGDRAGLLVALVRHMDETLDLGAALVHVLDAPDGRELLVRLMRLNTEFWSAVHPVAQVLEAGRHTDPALGAAWCDRMELRRGAFAAMIDRLAALEELATWCDRDDAAALLYGVAHYDTWRELTLVVGWSADRYVTVMSGHLARSLLRGG